MTDARLAGKVALVTGAARGQGRAHARRLAREGANLILCDVCKAFATTAYPPATPDDLRQTVSQVESDAPGCKVIAEEVDVRDLAGLQAFVDRAADALGHLDVVVANAGIDSAARAWEITPEQWDELFDVNLKGVWHTTKVAIPRMIEQGTGGSIILTSSTAGLKGLPFKAHYSAAKHGVVGLGRTLANELGEFDIRVNMIHPAGVRTPMPTDPILRRLIDAHAETLGPIFMNSLPHDFMDPDDIANSVAFLASDESRYMTGAQLVIDMGNQGR